MLQEINYLSDPIVLHIWASLHNYSYEEAIFSAERLFQETQHEEALFLLATCYFRKSLYHQTIKLLQTRGCSLPKTKYLLAQSFWNLNQLKEVEIALLGTPYPINKESLKDSLVKEYGDQACYVLLLLGDVYRFSGQHPRAIECFKICLQLNPLMWGAFERLCDLGEQEDLDPKTIFTPPVNAQLSVQTLHVASQNIFSHTLLPGNGNDRNLPSSQSNHSGNFQQPLLHPHSHRQVLSSNKIQSNSNSSLGVADRVSSTNSNELLNPLLTNSSDNSSSFGTRSHQWQPTVVAGQDNIVSRENQNPNDWVPFVSTSENDMTMDTVSNNGSITPITLSPADPEQTNKPDQAPNSPIMTAVQAPNIPSNHQLLVTPAHIYGPGGSVRTPDSPPRIYLSATAPKPGFDRRGSNTIRNYPYRSRTCIKGVRGGFAGGYARESVNTHSPSHFPTFGMLSMHLHSPLFASVPVFSPNRSPTLNSINNLSPSTPSFATSGNPCNNNHLGSLEMAANSLIAARGQSTFQTHRPSPTTSPSSFPLESGGNTTQLTMSPQQMNSTSGGRVLRSSARRGVSANNNSNSIPANASSLIGIRSSQMRNNTVFGSVTRGSPSSSNNNFRGSLRQTVAENPDEQSQTLDIVDNHLGDAESVSSFKENSNMVSNSGSESTAAGPRTRSQVARAAMATGHNHLSTSSASSTTTLRTPPHYSTAGTDNNDVIMSEGFHIAGRSSRSEETNLTRFSNRCASFSGSNNNTQPQTATTTTNSSTNDADELFLEAWEMRSQSLTMYLHLLRQFGDIYRNLTLYNCTAARDKMALISPTQMTSALVTLWCARAFVEESCEERACILLRDLHLREPWQTLGMDEYSAILWNLHREVELSSLATDMLNLDKRFSHVPWCVAGNCMSLHRDHDLALRYFKRAVEVNPRYAIAFRLLGHEYKAKDEYEKALTAYREALHLDSRQHRALSGISEILFLQERFAMAEFPLMEALSICPNSSFLWTHLGVVRAKLQRYHGPEGAIACLEKARELQKSNVICRYQYARILIRIGKYQKALKELEELRQIKPREPGVLSLLGNVHMRLGNHPQGMSYLAWAMEMDPKGAGGSSLNDVQLHCSLYSNQVPSTIGGDTSHMETIADVDLDQSSSSIPAPEIGRDSIDTVEMDDTTSSTSILLGAAGIAPPTPVPIYSDLSEHTNVVDHSASINLPLSNDSEQA